MRRWYQSRTPFEKRFKSFEQEEWARSLQYLLSSQALKFPARKFFKTEGQIDSVYLELTCFCFFAIDLHFETSIPDSFEGKQTLRQTQFDFNFLVMEEMWHQSQLLTPIINDRMKFYADAASNGWPIAEIAMNINISATQTVDRNFVHASQLPPFDPGVLALGAEWAEWASRTRLLVPECWNILYDDE